MRARLTAFVYLALLAIAGCSGGGGGGDDIQTGLTEEGDFQSTPETALILIMVDDDSEIRGDCDGATDQDWLSVHRSVASPASFSAGIEFSDAGSFELRLQNAVTFAVLDSAAGASPLVVASATTGTDILLGIVCTGTDGAAWEGGVLFE